ncbi:MAG: DUF2690 domain-containing protein [Actinomycetales bacterium]|nr:DUF2690 domain-containing protein [Actinomycetales bacterium]
MLLDRKVTAGEMAPARGVRIGHLELRYSLTCDSAWARFVPTPGSRLPAPVSLYVTASRAADGAGAKYHVTHLNITRTDMYLTWRGGVQAIAEISIAEGAGKASATTRCLRRPAMRTRS